MIDDTGPAAKTAKPLANKSSAAFRTIGEVAEELGVAQHVLRFWETRFPQVQPLKRGGNRRYYRPGDVELLRDIHRKLHAEGYTIKGVQKLLAERGKGGATASSGGFDELSLSGGRGLGPTGGRGLGPTGGGGLGPDGGVGPDKNVRLGISGEGAPPSFTARAELVEAPRGVDLAGVRAVRDRLASALTAARA